MPHVIEIDDTRSVLRDRLDVSPDGAAPLARIHRLADGDALALLCAPATRDGLAVLGNVVRIAWGESTVVRVGGRRIGITWSSELRRELARGGTCRLCGGTLPPGEPVAVCHCESPYHEECDEARFDCLSCGAPA
jgi:hypothetical protein